MFNLSNIARILVICASLLQIQCTSSVEEASNGKLNAFFGTYTGSSSNVGEGEISERDLAVTIKPKKMANSLLSGQLLRIVQTVSRKGLILLSTSFPHLAQEYSHRQCEKTSLATWFLMTQQGLMLHPTYGPVCKTIH